MRNITCFGKSTVFFFFPIYYQFFHTFVYVCFDKICGIFPFKIGSGNNKLTTSIKMATVSCTAPKCQTHTNQIYEITFGNMDKQFHK